MLRRSQTPAPGTVLRTRLSESGDEELHLRVIADADRDLRQGTTASGEWSLAPFSGAVLVEATVGGRIALPGAWIRENDLAPLERIGLAPVELRDLRLPAVIWGRGERAELVWGQSRWRMPLDPVVIIPPSLRAAVHSLVQVRRLALVALGRRAEVALTLWQDPDFDVPWHDVRLAPRAATWFELAQVPPTMIYADAARAAGIDVDAQVARLGIGA